MPGFFTGCPAVVIGRGLELSMECRPGRTSIELWRRHLTRISPYIFVAGVPRSGVHCSQPVLEIPHCGLPFTLSGLYNVLLLGLYLVVEVVPEYLCLFFDSCRHAP
jgi:hypothetical protein